MKDINFTQALRYVFPGVVAFLYFYILFQAEASDFAKATTILGFPLILIGTGCGIYFIFRALLYDQGIERLLFLWTPFKPNYRQELASRYNIKFTQTTHLFIQIRDEHLKERYSGLNTFSAGIQMIYQAGVLTLVAAVIAAYKDCTSYTWVILLIIGILVLIAAYFNDARYERIERDMLVMLGWQKIDAIAERFGYIKKLE